MEHLSHCYCDRCGAPIPGTVSRCAACGYARDHHIAVTTTVADAQISRLLIESRQYQQQGDLPHAIVVARQALALRPDCSSIHALLGHLYDQTGDTAAARYHFQAALLVSPGNIDAVPTMPPTPQDAPSPRQAIGGWVALVLTGCVIFSGLAAMFIAFWPSPDSLKRVTATTAAAQITKSTHSVQPPVSAPSSASTGIPFAASPSSMHASMSTPPAPQLETKPSPLTPAAAEPMCELVTFDPATVDQDAADEAYAKGQYATAARMYDLLLARGDSESPYFHKRLALCFHAMSNHDAAVQHMRIAADGYHAQLDADPANTAVREEFTYCTASLRSMKENTRAPHSASN